MSNGMRHGIVWAATAAVSMGGFAATAQGGVDGHFQSHALRYAGMIERAYGRLHGFIRHRSTAVVSWSGAAVPPVATGWEAVWTEAGLRARYCDNVLLVYFGAAEAKGVGGAHRAIQQARRSFLPERERGVKLPMLSWLEASRVVDAHGSDRSLPACITANYLEPLPSGRAALAGDVVDPWTELRELESFEHREAPCPPGKHGVKRHRRTVTQEFNKSDAPVGAPVHGAWESAPGSWCRDDYTYYELFTRPCTWYQGEPFNQNMEGTETWRVPVSVSADPDNPVGGTRKTTGASEFVSSTCWGTAHGPVPVPTTNHEYFTETSTLSCPSGMTGQIATARQRITTTTTYPWGEEPLVAVDYTNWSETSNSCAHEGGGEGSDDGENPGSTNGSDGSAGQVSVDYSMDFGGAQGIAGMSDGSVVDYSE